MINKPKKIYLFIAYLLFSTMIHCPLSALSLYEFLDAITNQHPLFKEQSINVTVQQFKLKSTKGSQDITLNSTLFNSSQEPYQSSPFAPAKITSTGLSTDLSKSFWSTGGNLSIGADTTQIKRNLPVSNFDLGPTKYYQNEVFIQYSQPLLSNLNGTQFKYQSKLESINLERTKLISKKTKEYFLSELSMIYFDWILAIEKEQILDNRLALGVKNVIETQNKYKSKLVDKVDVLRAQTSLKGAEQAKLLHLGEKKSIETTIQQLSGSAKIVSRQPIYDIFEIPSLSKPQTDTLYDERLLAFSESLLRENLAFQKDIAKDSLYLTAKGSFLGASTNFKDASSLNRMDQSISLSYSKKIGNTESRSKIKKIELELEKLAKIKEKTSIDTNKELNKFKIRIENLKAMLKLSAMQTKLANQQTREEINAYKQGRSSLNFVIQAQDRELNTKLNLLNNTISLQKTIFQYYVFRDTLLQQFEDKKL